MKEDRFIAKILAAIQNPSQSLYRAKRGNLVHGIQDAVRQIKQHHKRSEIINQKEIRVIGLRRTGNHALINWIAQQQNGVVWCLNNLPVDENPYRHRYEYPEKSDPLWQVERLLPEAQGHFTAKDCLIYSYEDYPLESIVSKKYEKKHDMYVGKSLKRYDLLIIRDPFNLIASRLKSGKIDVKTETKDMVDLWIDYAKEFLGETEYLNQSKICLNYNEWFQNVEYRKEIANQLELEFSDRGKDEVSYHGGGSSFDRRKLEGKATQMDVLNRWKHFCDDPNYRQLLNNQQLIEYSERIFGQIPGTELLYSSI